MTYPHPFRLHGPWQVTALTAEDDGAKSEITLSNDGPAGWYKLLGDDYRGQVRLARRFGRPSNLEQTETVWLIAEELPAGCQATLNGRRLGQTSGAGETGQWEVTQRLAPRNELWLEFAVDDEASRDAGCAGPREVRLEVRGTG